MRCDCEGKVRDASKRIVKTQRDEQEMKGNNGGHMCECEGGKAKD